MLIYLTPLWKGDRLATQTVILSPSLPVILSPPLPVILSVAKNLMALRTGSEFASSLSLLSMTQGKRKEKSPPKFGGLSEYQEVLSIKLESGYSSGSDYQDKQGNNQHRTNTDYDINPGRCYLCFYYIW